MSLTDAKVHDCGTAVAVQEGATAAVTGVDIKDCTRGIKVVDEGSHADVRGKTTISGCSEVGVAATLGGQVWLTDIEVRHCATAGVLLKEGATAVVTGVDIKD